jgi:hypothetical protein
MSKWLVLPVVVLPFIATAASGAAVRDRDHDRLGDRWEKRYHLSTSKKSAKGDPDHDRLRNLREYRLRTNPRRKDTDGDGLRDRAEVRRYHTNPRKKDTDGDGYGDGVEVRAGTNPRKRGSHPPGSAPPAPTPENPAPAPSPSGLPDASNTGVPPGTTLTPSGDLTISAAGAVVDARAVTGTITVNAPNVTIRRTRVDSDAFRAIASNSTGLVVEDSEIVDTDGGLMCHNAIGFGGFTVRRTEIQGCENGADAGGGMVFEDNWVHDLAAPGTGTSQHPDGSPHIDGIQAVSENARIVHNTIDPLPDGRGGGTSAIIMNTDGAGHDVSIEDNYLDGRGSSYALYANRQTSTGVNINRNQMHRGAYGYTACVRPGVTVSAFDGNRDAGTGALIGPDNGAGGSCSN